MEEDSIIMMVIFVIVVMGAIVFCSVRINETIMCARYVGVRSTRTPSCVMVAGAKTPALT